jgi:hypothetical protein
LYSLQIEYVEQQHEHDDDVVHIAFV